jgi:hypothetical protein
MAFENKRGQEGITLTTILLLILGVVVVVLVILFATGFFDKLGDATNNLPGSLQAAVSACEIAGSSELTADYCSTFRKVEINGIEQYQTCDSAAIRAYTADNKEMACGTSVTTGDMNAYCASQKLDKGTKVGTVECTGEYAAAS